METMRLKEQALNRLVYETLLMQAAKHLEIRVSNAELQEQIRNYPVFQEKGQFNGSTVPGDGSGAFPGGAAPQRHRDCQVLPGTPEPVLHSGKGQGTIPLVPPQRLSGKVQPTAEEFIRAQVIQVQELSLKVLPKATAAEKRQIENQAQALLRQTRIGEYVTPLVHKFSQDPVTKEKGEVLREVKRGQHPPEWDNVAFSLKKNEVGLAVTSQGFHLLRLEEIKKSENLLEAEASSLAGQHLLSNKSRRLTREAAQKARGELNNTPKAEVAKKYGVQVKAPP